MKYILCIIIILFISPYLFSQTLSDLSRLNNYAEIMNEVIANDEILNRASENEQIEFERWKTFWSTRVDRTGDMDKFNDKLNDYNTNYFTYHNIPSSLLVWQELGPKYRPVNNDFVNSGQGRINCLWVDPYNYNHILAGASGLWETTNGGINWNCLSDEYATGGVYGFAVDPNNSSIIYIATKTRPNGTFMWNNGYSTGIWKTTNGGNTWSILNITFPDNDYFEEILIDPLNTKNIYALSKFNVYKSINSGSTWTAICPYVNTGLKNMVFKSDDPTTLYVSGENALYIASNGGNSWNNITSNLALASGNSQVNIDVDKITNELFALIFYTAPKKTELKKSTDAGYNWTTILDTTKILNARAHVQIIKLSPNGDIYAGGVNIKRIEQSPLTTSGFLTKNRIHDDIRDIIFPDPSNNSLVYTATDGGVYKSIDKGTNWIRITGDLAANEFYGIDIIDDYPEAMIGGTHDCSSYYRTTTGTWEYVWGGDGGSSLIEKEIPTNFYACSNQDIKYFINNKKNYNVDDRLKELQFYNSPLEMDPSNSKIIYYHSKDTNITEGPKNLLYRCVNNNNIFTKTEMDRTWNPTYDIAIKYSDPNFIYYSDWSAGAYAKLRKTSDGINFSDVNYNDISYSCERAPITGICVEPFVIINPKLFICFGGFLSSKKIFYSINNGNSWTDITGTGLPKLPIQCIEYDYHNQMIYAGTDVGLFSKNIYDSEWLYCTGFPHVIVSMMKINKSNGDLVVSTYGRGVWRTNLWESYCIEQSQLTTYYNNSITLSMPTTTCQNITLNSGSTLKIKSTLIMPCNTTITAKSGSILEIDAGKIKNGKIVIESGGHLNIKNGGTISIKNSNMVDVQLGGTLEISDGEIIIL